MRRYRNGSKKLGLLDLIELSPIQTLICVPRGFLYLPCGERQFGVVIFVNSVCFGGRRVLC